MDGEEVQPTRISKDEYVRFKQYVQDTHGTTRGHLSTEIENALREYRKDDSAPERLARIEEDVSRLAALMAEAEGDGGTVPDESDVHTHTPTHTTTEKPPANGPRNEKVEYIAESLLDGNRTEVGPPHIRSEIQSEYSFGSRTVDKLVPSVIEELAGREGTVRHPKNDEIIGWGESAETFRSWEQEETEDGDTNE